LNLKKNDVFYLNYGTQKISLKCVFSILIVEQFGKHTPQDCIQIGFNEESCPRRVYLTDCGLYHTKMEELMHLIL